MIFDSFFTALSGGSRIGDCRCVPWMFYNLALDDLLL